MILRQPLLTAALTLGLLVGCSNRSSPEPRPAESGGTPTTPMETPPANKPLPSSAANTEAPSGGTAAPSADRGPAVFYVRDSGVRCMAAPCPSYIATRVDRPGEDGLKVTDVDLSALNLSDEKRNSIIEGTHMGSGIKVEATVETVPNAGPAGAATVLRVQKVVDSK
ncbi:DUF6748 domain-containing protein [Vitiosangium sp. GDMCC 1.1324]|uniref:DUF6748 domain-containing protein n=1 Tax=Vitiosangium sp. (strain GDMCC 1.1324) TaxID=2138576 RepID=UPI000D3C38DB|nr:DUF6748 domain-containing protein [Vitiosangium sp. GDMCC 1.1324]PTL84812.1 hypothetical protein DAT35_07065 [Vitiosangium sp. GDMCC 1.1324]